VRQILTDALCRTKPPSSGRLEIADLRQAGLVLRVTSNGSRSFAYRFRHPHTRKTLRAHIGAYPAITLENARKRARELAEQVASGVNPIEARNAERKAAPARTFEALACRYLKEHAERHKRPRSAEEDRRNLAVHVLPKWAKRDYQTIRRADVIELVESIIGAGKHAAANRVHGLVSKIFNFGIDADLLDANPAARLKKRGVERPRSRILNDAEIAAFWNGIVLPPVSRSIGLALRLALLTAARASEIAGARKDEFEALDDSSRAAWLIVGERTKNKRDHLTPLAPLAAETVKAAIELSGTSDFLFPNRLSQGRPISRHSLAGAMARFAAGRWQSEPPTAHDLRRTVATKLAALGVPGEDVSACLGHTPQHITKQVYDKYDRAREKRAAFGKWAAEVEAIIEPADVVPIRGQRR
jgi:integrase